jgi:hypothetical protein
VTETAFLNLGDAVIARLDDVRPDQPWFVCRFTPEPGFAEVQHLFQQELALVEGDDFDPIAWDAVWEELWRRGLTLNLPGGRRLTTNFAVHVYDDGTARFRY